MSFLSFPPLRDPAVALRKVRKNRRKTSAFPLRRLPFVALRGIIEKMELKEQCMLSFCSKRIYYVVKNFRGKSPLSLKLIGATGYTEMYIFNSKNLKNAVRFEVRADGGIYCLETIDKFQSSFKETERIFSHGKNAIQGTKFLVDFLCDLFSAKVEEVEVYDTSTWMLDFVEKRQGGYSYDAIVRNNAGRTDKQIKHILLDLNPRSLDFNQAASHKFRIKNFDKKYENLTIFERWVAVENLYQLDCVKLNIYLKDFSNTEINRYLKHVLSGGAQRLRKFSAAVRNPTENVIMDGIRELLMGSERVANRLRDWNVIGKVAKGEELVLVSIKLTFQTVHLEIKEA